MGFFDELFNKKENKNPKDFYQMIAAFNLLLHKKDNVYTNDKAGKFVLTRYGFVPVEQHNLKLLTEQQERQILNLETDVVVLESKLKKAKKEIEATKKELEKEKENKKEGVPIIRYSFKPQLDKLKRNYLTMMNNNHNLIEKVKKFKKENQKLSTELLDEKGKYKILQNSINAQLLSNDQDIITKINAVIMYAENNQIAKMLEKLKSVVAHQENLKQKSHNQKALITRLESINYNLEKELFELKRKGLDSKKY